MDTSSVSLQCGGRKLDKDAKHPRGCDSVLQQLKLFVNAGCMRINVCLAVFAVRGESTGIEIAQREEVGWNMDLICRVDTPALWCQ